MKKKFLSQGGRIFILPTGFGLVFLCGSMLMILVGATYQNNLVNLLAFFMLSLIFVSMVQTHLNLRDIKIQSLEVEPNYVGRDLIVTAVLANGSKDSRFNLEFSLRKMQSRAEYDQVHPLLAKSSIKLKSAYLAEKRGLYSINDVRIFTDYPLGLFRAWMWLNTKADYYIFPEPIGTNVSPRSEVGDSAPGRRPMKGGHDFSGHRRFQIGDPMARIDWKAHARGRKWMLKEFDEGHPDTLKFDWNALEGMGHEAKLSQFAAWIEQAEKQKTPYSVSLPGMQWSADFGSTHANRILKALAVLEERAKVKPYAA
jgi:uncharacterized protein (DUF58 family)